MSAFNAGVAVERLEAMVGTERHPAGRLGARPTEQHPRDCSLEVVVADVHHRHPTQHRERVDVAFQERLLTLGGEHPVHRLTLVGQAQREQETLRGHPVQVHPQIPEIHLRFGGRLMGLRDEPRFDAPARLGPDLRAAPGHVVTHRRVPQLAHAVLIDQTRQHPADGVTLLAPRREILPQHRIDQRLGRVQLRRRPRRCLPRRRLHGRQRLADREAVHPVPVRQRPDRQLLPAVITPDLLEQLHP